MLINRLILFLFIAILFLESCVKFNAEPTFAGATLARIWAKQEPFYRPVAEVYIDSTNRWQTFTGFSITSEAEPDKLGFANPYVAGKGTNALYMNTIYDRWVDLTADSGFYNVTIAKCFQFIPSEPGSKTGEVRVIEQRVPMYKRDKTRFEVGIKGSGTYSELTQSFEVEVTFDETELGGPADRKRKYRFRS